MANTVQITLETKGNGININNAIAYFKGLENHKVSSGFHKDVGAEILKRAVHTEFGGSWYEEPYGASGTVPPRPVVRMYLYPEVVRAVGETYKDNIDNEKDTRLKIPNNNVVNTLENLGEVCSDLQKQRISIRDYDESTNDTPFDPNYNGEKTIKWKGFDHPWIQTGQTLDAIDYKVEKR